MVTTVIDSEDEDNEPYMQAILGQSPRHPARFRN